VVTDLQRLQWATDHWSVTAQLANIACASIEALQGLLQPLLQDCRLLMT